MRRNAWYSGLVAFFFSILLSPGWARGAAETPQSSGLDTAQIERLTGANGTLNAAEGVFKVSVPRSDLHVTVDGQVLKPAMGLASWAAFHRVGANVMVMGDMVLTQEQVAPAMRAALDHGLSVTALHNHLLGEEPRIMYMHIEGKGDEETLAGSIGALFAEMEQSARARHKVAGYGQVDTTLDVENLARILGHKGEYKDGVFKVVVGRTVQVDGHPMGAAMGVNTWAAFSGFDKRVFVDGDFAVLESELQPVLRTLTQASIQVVAIHQHMVGEAPRMMFLHYWYMGNAEFAAKALRAALDQTGK
jgi:CII-binding regulator of phage lambda lysogenization HflD